jgi:hypothetical protein
MKPLLKLSALLEVPTGLGLVVVPTVVVRLLLGGELVGAGIPLGRVAGVALLALGIACWLASFDVASCAARGIVTAMGLYNLVVALILGATGIQSNAVGVALWPAVLLHTAMAVWCIACLLRKPTL